MKKTKPRINKSTSKTIKKEPFLKSRRKSNSLNRKSPPQLRFSPYAWAKLQYLCHRGDTEIGGFGISCVSDLLLIEDFVLVQQEASSVSICFDDESVADLFDLQVDQGRQPSQFARIWLHTHPGDCPYPSGTDEETFSRVFGHCDWAIMFILAKGGQTYARLRYQAGPDCQHQLPVSVDYGASFEASDQEAWELEYKTNVRPEPMMSAMSLAEQWGVDLNDPASFELLDEQEQLELLSLADGGDDPDDMFPGFSDEYEVNL